MAKWIFTFIVLFMVLTGCGVEDNVAVISTSTPLSTIQPSAAPTRESTATPIPSLTLSPDVMSYKCLEVAESLPTGHSLKGVMVYIGDIGNYNFVVYLQNQEMNETHTLPREEGDRLLNFEVSPDGKWIMYDHFSEKTQENRLVIATAKGEPIWSQIVDSSILWRWFDNERLIRREFLGNDTYALQLLKPFTGEIQNLPVDFPNFEEDVNPGFLSFPIWSFSKGGYPVYDPTLTRVVYPGTADHGNEEWPIIIWDVKAEKQAAQFVTKDFWGGTPFWTPDGRQFVISSKLNSQDPFPPANEFLAISRDGEVRQLTHFTKYFDETWIANNYSMSPNGKLVAFWAFAQPGPFENAQLAVLDIDTGATTNYCIKGDPFLLNAYGQESLRAPIWSPDSTQLLVISRPSENSQIRRVVMVDIVNSYAAQINKDVEPVGWMIAP